MDVETLAAQLTRLKAADGMVSALAISSAWMTRIKAEVRVAEPDKKIETFAGITLTEQPLLPDGMAQIRWADGRAALWQVATGKIIPLPKFQV